MYADYVRWQFVSGPTWLLKLFATLQQYLWRYFSVPFMVRSLFAYWRRDSVTTRGSLSTLLTALALNSISRGIGAIVRLSVIMCWAITAAAFSMLYLGLVLCFVLWPLSIAASLAVGLALLVAS